MLSSHNNKNNNNNNITTFTIKSEEQAAGNFPFLLPELRDTAAALREICKEILYDLCKDCAKMAALPQGAFAACKLREQFREREFRDLMTLRMKSSGSEKGEAKNVPNSNKKLMEYSPVKYNGKLMNSIWGFYNRYSPHNIKAMEYESPSQRSYAQQHSAVASTIAADFNAMGFGGATGNK